MIWDVNTLWESWHHCNNIKKINSYTIIGVDSSSFSSLCCLVTDLKLFTSRTKTRPSSNFSLYQFYCHLESISMAALPLSVFLFSLNSQSIIRWRKWERFSWWNELFLLYKKFLMPSTQSSLLLHQLTDVCVRCETLMRWRFLTVIIVS